MVRLDLRPTNGRRQPAFGASVQPGRHSPATGRLPLGQLVHSVGVGPEHSVHDGSQTEQPVSPVAVHMALSNWPDGHVVQELHAELPVPLAKVPAVQPMQLEVPCAGWAVPAGQLSQLLEPGAGCAEPDGQLRQDGWPGNG